MLNRMKYANYKLRNMKLSARSYFTRIVKTIAEAFISTKVVIDLGNGNKIISVVSKGAMEDLELEVSNEVVS